MASKELSPSDLMSLTRTTLAIDRSLMAWVRTALSLIGFGFTIYTFLSALVAKGTIAMQDAGPKRAGAILIALGTGSLIFGVIEYWKGFRHFRDAYGLSPWRVSLVTSLIVASLGLILLILTAFGQV